MYYTYLQVPIWPKLNCKHTSRPLGNNGKNGVIE